MSELPPDGMPRGPLTRPFTENERAALYAAERRRQAAAAADQRARAFQRELQRDEAHTFLTLPKRLNGPGRPQLGVPPSLSPPPASPAVQPPHAGQTAHWPDTLHHSVAYIIATTPRPGSPEDLTKRILDVAKARLVERLSAQASPTGRAVRTDRIERNLTVLRPLVLAALTLLQTRGHAPRLFTTATYFTVLDVLPAITGLAPSTCQLALADLRACHLIATRREYQPATFYQARGEAGQITHHAVTMNAITGVYLCVALKPERDLRPMVLTGELPHEAPRDLAADRQVGRTAWQIRQEAREAQEVGASFSHQERKELFSAKTLLFWSLSEKEKEKSVQRDAPTFGGGAWNDLDRIRRAVLAARRERPQLRRERVEEAARMIGGVLSDLGPISLKGYCRMIWRGLRGEREQRPALMGLLDAISRTLTFRREAQGTGRPLRKPGAYLRRVLEESGWMAREYRST